VASTGDRMYSARRDERDVSRIFSYSRLTMVRSRHPSSGYPCRSNPAKHRLNLFDSNLSLVQRRVGTNTSELSPNSFWCCDVYQCNWDQTYLLGTPPELSHPLISGNIMSMFAGIYLAGAPLAARLKVGLFITDLHMTRENTIVPSIFSVSSSFQRVSALFQSRTIA
jgi:hypothetical protein